MALTPQEAATIASRHGLSLQDAAGLLTLADTPEEAERIAADFADEDAQSRAFVRNLFTPNEPTGMFAAGRTD